MLRNGSSGDEVLALQQALARNGISPGQLDGIFGPKTEAAVREYQEKKGLAVDGIVGPMTMGQLGMAMPGADAAPADDDGGGDEATPPPSVV